MKGIGKQSQSAAKPARATVHKSSGVVKKVDPAAGTVTPAHAPVPALNLPAMTMNFKV